MGLPGDRQVCSQVHENTTTMMTTNLKTGVMMVVPVTLTDEVSEQNWEQLVSNLGNHESIMETNLQ